MECYRVRELILDSLGIFKLRGKAALYSDLIESRGIRDMIRIAKEKFGKDFLDVNRIEEWTLEEQKIMWEVLKREVEPNSYTGKVFLLLNDFLEHLIGLFLSHIKECQICLDFLLFICPEVLYEGLSFEILEKDIKEIFEKIGLRNNEIDVITFTERIWGKNAEKIDCGDFSRNIEDILRRIIEGKEIQLDVLKNYFYHFYSCESCEELLIEKASSINQLYRNVEG